MSILVVEGDPTAAMALENWLREDASTDFEIEHVGSMHDAWKQGARDRYDAVIVGLASRGLDRVQALEEVRLLSERLPTIVITGSDEVDFGRRLIEAGAQEVLFKGQVTSLLLVRMIVFARERFRMVQAIGNRPYSDKMTGLMTQTSFLASAERELNHAQRSRTRHTLILWEAWQLAEEGQDLKPVTEQRTLISVALVLKKTFRASDFIARYGGNCFAILVRESDFAGSRIVEKRLEALFLDLKLMGYFGFAIYDPELPRTIHELVRQAEGVIKLERERSTDKRRAIQRLSSEVRIPPDLWRTSSEDNTPTRF